RRGLPPPCGIHPAVRGAPAHFSLRPLARWGHIEGMEFFCKFQLLRQIKLLPPGPHPGVQLFPVADSLAPGGGNALSGFWFLLPVQKKPPAGSASSLARGERPRLRLGRGAPSLPHFIYFSCFHCPFALY